MTREQAAQAMAAGARVIAEAGEDTDTGFILELRDEPEGSFTVVRGDQTERIPTQARTMARVGWDSCQESETDIDALELAETL